MILSTRWERKTQLRTLKSGFVFEGAVAGRALAEWMAEGFDAVTGDALPEAIETGANRLATDAEALMKRNAKWKDRTGNARRGLYAIVGREGTFIFVELGHGKDVTYGIWLENRWNGKYAIILPTSEVVMPQLAALIQGDLRLVIGGRGSAYRHTSSGRFARAA